MEPEIPKATVNWRIWELVQRGELERIGRGIFIRGNNILFVPLIQPALKKLHEQITQQFPYINYCVWENDMIKTFQHHLSGSKFMLVDVEKEASAAVFDFIKEHVKQQVWLKPNEEIISKYILQSDTINIIIRQLTTEAPLQLIQGTPTVTIEKMLVDLYGDQEFDYMDDNEKVGIFRNAYERFTVNQNKLLRYASRKSKRKKIGTFLKRNNIIR